MSTAVRTTCPYCGVGCGVIAEPGPRGVHVRGDPDHPANHGRLCAKGANLGETVGDGGRLRHPEIRGRRVSWFRALDEVADGFRRVIDTHGPEAVAIYASGQLLTEDYYLANKLMKGYIGAANIDTNSRLCMSSAVAAHEHAFGEDVVPGDYTDLDQADLAVLVGSNTAWCHPVLYRRLRDAREADPQRRMVVIDPRTTATAREADLHLAIRPGTDAWLFNGLLAHLARTGAIDRDWVEAHTGGLDAAVAAARRSAPDTTEVARACGLVEADVARFFDWFAATPRTLTLFSQGVNQSSSGTDKAGAILNCHLATGRVGRPGAGPFSLTGQPNAMGGREVGGLASTLAGHRGFDAAAAVQAFWGSPAIAGEPGLKAVDLFEAIHAGRVRAVWIMATNPAVSLPDTERVREALHRCELVVVSDMTRETDTAAWADVLLPAAAWGEKDGTVTNSERRISRQRPFRDAPGEARPDWWMIAAVARRMGYTGFDYAGPHEIFDEHARLSALDGAPRAFDIGGLAGLDRAGYDALAPRQWPLPAAGGAEHPRLFADGGFPTADGRARLQAVEPRAPAHATDADYPLSLNSGRVRDHWHTLTRSARAPRLCGHTPEPRLAVSPADAAALGLATGGLARVESAWGTTVVRVEITPEQAPGAVFLPMHWSEQFASGGRAGALVNPAVCPRSGEPEFKHTPVRVTALATAWQGVAVARGRLDVTALDCWTRVPGRGHERYELAHGEVPADWHAWARTLLDDGTDGDWLEYADPRAGRYRAALIGSDGSLHACVYATPDEEGLPERYWLTNLFEAGPLDGTARFAVLAGRPSAVTG
ncbi:molybdopterin oxidoreductase family protein [Arhodomonas aquaeolei]|uniref:molybdopterin oxidoreductase family protein n=1 Tax=Arhodomonas aquaeolei TaxID=2369 RepID=UPI000380AEE5|nr:nitrate reductase [Arhodomonas aquaeolei]